MSFLDDYNSSVSSSKSVNSDFTPSMLISQIHSYPDQPDYPVGCIRMEASGSHMINDFFLIKIKKLDYYMVIFTKSGACEISSADRTVTVRSGMLSITECNHEFTLRPTTIPWNYRIIFFDKSNTQMYRPVFENDPCRLFNLQECSPILSEIGILTSMPSCCAPADAIQIHCSLTSILCRLFLSDSRKKNPGDAIAPKYIVEVKNYMETHYAEKFSLDDCAKLYGVNKYRICRDFQEAFGDSPVHYLNEYRLSCAKKLLLSDELNIHEISSMVGFENVNHFINLFKKSNGITPGAFRQKSLNG